MTDEPKEKPTGLALLRAPFPPGQISKLPKPTKAQTEAVRKDFKSGIRCKICGAWHHPNVVHLDYVGHAALTDRLLDCDPEWNWEPVATNEDGTPKVDSNGGMWIRLTVCGVTRLGYGHADGKHKNDATRADAYKEIIGDALRNAAMRFGAALDLWHKGQLHDAQDDDGNDAGQGNGDQFRQQRKDTPQKEPKAPTSDAVKKAKQYLTEAENLDELRWRFENLPKDVRSDKDVIAAKDARKAALTPMVEPSRSPVIDGNEIPY